MSASREISQKGKIGCYLCENNIPHNEAEHAEVLQGGLRAKHKRVYKGMSGHGQNPRMPKEANHTLRGDVPLDERLRHYMRHGRSRKQATERLGYFIRAQIKRSQQREDTGEMNTNDLSRLTLRGRQVLRAISEGLTNKEIANRLKISEKTVKAHVTNILQALGVKSRTLAAIGYLSIQDEAPAEVIPEAAPSDSHVS